MRHKRLWFGAAAAVVAAAGLWCSSPAVAQTMGKRARLAPTVAPASTEVVVVLGPRDSARKFASRYQFRVVQSLRSMPNAWVMDAGSPFTARLAAAALRSDPSVQAAYVNQRVSHSLTTWAPNDPLYPRNTPVAGWAGQWYLKNTVTAGLDVSVTDAWNRDYTGLGVLVASVDQGVETTHADLAAGFSAADSWNFVSSGADITPGATEPHGTAVVGLMAARGGNSTGITGAAPLASWAGLALSFGASASTEAQFADATLFHSSGANTAITIKTHGYGINVPYISVPLERDALAVSSLAGTIHVLAAGNDRTSALDPSIGTSTEDSNKKDIQSSPDAITVAALGSDGKFASYSSYGANVFVTAPSSGSTLPMLTTDLTGSNGYNSVLGDTYPNMDYTSIFGGTSAAAPLVAGVLATTKQAQPLLNTRFAKHLLARTSLVVDASDATASSDGGWKTNGAGFKFNQNYGFGLVQADKLALAAVKYRGVTPLESVVINNTITTPISIPDNNPTGVTKTFNIGSTTPVEEMQITIDAMHTFGGDLTAWLTSPMGTTSRLFVSDPWDMNPISWTFISNAFWGEDPQGTWTLRVADVAAGDVGTLDSVSVIARLGTLIDGITVTVANVAGNLDQTVNLTATLTQTGTVLPYVAPAGVTFYLGGTLLGTASVNASGVATLPYTIPMGATLGANTIRAEIAADGDWIATHGTGYLTISAAATKMTVAAKTANLGDTITLTGTLATLANTALAGQTVQVLLDGAALGTAVTDAAGTGSYVYTVPASVTVGSHTITVSFAGTTLYQAVSNTGTLTVSAAPSTVTVPAVAGFVGRAVTLSATLASQIGGVTGKTLTFRVNGVSVGTATTNASGVATLSYTAPIGTAGGLYPLAVSFAGDATHAAGSGSSTLTLTVIPQTYIFVSAPAVTAPYYNTVNLGGQLKTLVTNVGVPIAETLTVAVDGTSIGTATTSTVAATLGIGTVAYTVPTTLTVGNHNVTVTFAGDSNYLGSAAPVAPATYVLTVTKATPTASVSAATVTRGSAVTLTAFLSRTGAMVGGATLTFRVDGVLVGTAVTSSTTNLGRAQLVVPGTVTRNWTAGAHSLTVSYAGTTVFNAVTSPAATLTVN